MAVTSAEKLSHLSCPVWSRRGRERVAPHPEDAPGDTLCPAGDSQVVLVSTAGEIPRTSTPGLSTKHKPLFPPNTYFSRREGCWAPPGRLRWCPRCGVAGAVTGTGGRERDPSLTGGVCGGCWPSPPIWPRYLLEELTCLGGLAGTGVPDGMWMCVVCRLSFSQINVRFVKRRREEWKKKPEKQLSKNPKNNRGHVPAVVGCTMGYRLPMNGPNCCKRHEPAHFSNHLMLLFTSNPANLQARRAVTW